MTESNFQITEIIVNNIKESIWVIDLNFKLIYGNYCFFENIENLFGFNIQIGENIFSEESLKIEKSVWAPALEDVFNGNTNFIKSPLTENKIFEFKLSPFTEEGKIKGCTIIAKDITEIVKNENFSKTNENILQNVYETINTGILIHDKSGKIESFNRVATKILGINREELLNRNFISKDWNAIKIDGSEFPLEEFPSNISKVKHNSLNNVKMGIRNTKKNSITWLEISSFPLPDPITNEVEKSFVIFEDITEEHLNEKKIFSAIQEVQNAFHNLSQLQEAISQHAILAITDKAGVIQFVNKKFVEISCYQKEELIGKTHKIINSGHHSKQFFKKMHNTINSGEIWKGQIKNKKKNGDYYWVDTTIVPIFKENGYIDRFIAIRTDITEKIKALENLGKAVVDLNNQNSTKEKLLKIISHDLRNPFGGIDGLTEVLLKNEEILNDKEKVKNIISLISYSTKNTFELLEDLLSWSNIHSNQIKFNPQFNDIQESLDRIYKLYNGVLFFKNITLRLNNNIKVKIYYDKAMLETVLRNIVMNSIKFTSLGGWVKIDAKLQEQKLILRVTDNGVGMNEEVKLSLFEKGKTLSTMGTNSEKGSGIGLLICQEFIEYHKGMIKVESEEKKGTSFIIEIPSKQES